MGIFRKRQRGSLLKKILFLIIVCFCLFAVGVAMGVVPIEWATKAETLLNGGKPIERDNQELHGGELFRSIIKQEEEAEISLFGSSDIADVEYSTNPSVNIFETWNGTRKYEPRIFTPKSTVTGDETLTVEFLDVGQADCTLIYTGSHAMVVDAGNIADGPLVAEYIRSLGISKLDYVVGTHAHEDHIGGLSTVIDEFDVGRVILPNTSPNPNGTFSYLCNTVKSSHTPSEKAATGTSYELGDAVWTVLSSSYASDESNENEYSTVIKLSYGNNTFLLMGDAEVPNERSVLMAGYDVDADVLRVGHHGSSTSSSDEWISAVSPSFAIFSVGAENSYGHPHKEIVTRFNEGGVSTYRTDEKGSIAATSDGANIMFTAKETNTDGN